MVDDGDLASHGRAPVTPGVAVGSVTGPGGTKGSWVGAVQGQNVLKKYDVEVTMKDGIGSVIVTEEITKDFSVMNQADGNMILRRGMWNLEGILVVMTNSSSVAEKEKPPAKSIPMFSWQGISFVASPVGSPVRLHLETTQCLNLGVAKIFVKADLTKDLPKKMNFNIQGQDILGLKCGKWGHTPKMCSANKDEQSEV
ncbi:hypothetical protein Bca4012_051069 [Brassica carinata]|uniref:Uncharacterized protein n=1 Tax=Brassica carinata TaxID=52824 RepID=A0A8X7UM11_BRACI|nr:hypothetical protein Bca52824_053746 [Brassica carinata]